MDNDRPNIGLGQKLHHVASFNLFIEPDGKLYATVSGGDVERIKATAKLIGIEADCTAADLAIKLLSMAENISS